MAVAARPLLRLAAAVWTVHVCRGTAPYPPGTDRGWSFNFQKVRSEPPADSLSVPDLVCSFYLPAPPVALCLGGAARTFAHHIVYRTIKTNFIDAYGGDLTTFAYLKLEDERGSVLEDGVSGGQGVHVGDLTKTDLSAVLYALRHVGVDEANMDIVVGNHSAPEPACPNYKARHDGTGVRDSAPYWRSLLGQIEARQKCYERIVEHERRTGKRFASVVFSRPDLAWPFPLLPWCYHHYSINRKKQDWIWWLNRDDVEEALHRPYADMYSCRRELPPGDTVENYFYDGQRPDFWHPEGHRDHPEMHGHILRVPTTNMGSTMCKQLLTPGLFPQGCHKDDALPRGWNCAETLHGNPYNHPN